MALKPEDLTPKPIENYKGDEKRIAYSNPFVKLFLIPFAGGLYNSIEVGATNEGVVILAKQGSQIFLVKQDRYPSGFTTWELPRGGVDEGESFVEAAMREFAEETGIILPVESYIPLGQIQPDSGVFSTRIETFFIEVPVDAKMGKISLGEIVDVDSIEEQLLWEAIKNGNIWYDLTLATLMLALGKQLLNLPTTS